MKRRKEPRTERIIKERIVRLFELARENVKKFPGRARRYVSLARSLSTRQRVRIPKRFKRQFCKKCNIFWIPGYNVKVRIKRGKGTEYKCECGALRRFGYKKQ